MTTTSRKKREPNTQPTYRETIMRARTRQLRLTATNVNRLARTYNAAAESIAARLLGMSGHMIGDSDTRMEQEYMRMILREIEQALGQFHTIYAERLRGSMLELAQAAAARERRVQELTGPLGTNDPLVHAEMTETFPNPDGTTSAVQYGRVAHDAVEALAARYYGDGLRLSDRLYGVDKAFRTGVADTLMQSLVEGLSVEQTMDRLVAGPLSKTTDAAYRAARIARTELAHAYTEAHARSLVDPTNGQLREGVQGVKWQLSTSHPVPDICDVWALHDEGHGPGVYSSMARLPSDHPNGLCFTTTVLEIDPESRTLTAGQVPDLGGITDAEIQRYADQGDVAAQAFMTGGKS
jgi:hypothetical protein